MEQGTKKWKDMEQEVTQHLAASQNRLEQMIQQIQEWTTPRHQPTEWLANQKVKKEAEAFYELEKERLQFFISFWEALKQMKEKSTFIQFLPNLYSKEWGCDGILLTTGGVYVFHLLPCRLTEFSLEHPILSVAGAKPVPVFQQDKISSFQLSDEPYSITFEKDSAKLWILGQDREKIQHLQKKLAISSLPIYELYVAPFGARDIRFLFEETVIASSEQVFELLQNLTIQPDMEQFENQQKLFYELSIYARPYEISLLSSQKTARRKGSPVVSVEGQQANSLVHTQSTQLTEAEIAKPTMVPFVQSPEMNPPDAHTSVESMQRPVEEQEILIPEQTKLDEPLRLDEGEFLSQKINDLFVENEQITLVPKPRRRVKETFLDRFLNKLVGKKGSPRHSHHKK